MRHRKSGRKLVEPSHRKAMFRIWLPPSLRRRGFRPRRRKQELRSIVEKLIASRAEMHLALLSKAALTVLQQSAVLVGTFVIAMLQKLFGELAERFVGRPGGYTRIVRLEAASVITRRWRSSNCCRRIIKVHRRSQKTRRHLKLIRCEPSAVATESTPVETAVAEATPEESVAETPPESEASEAEAAARGAYR